MADKRINALANTAPSTASDDFIAVDGTTNGTRKLNAFSPTFGGNATVTGTLTVNGTGTSEFGGLVRITAGGFRAYGSMTLGATYAGMGGGFQTSYDSPTTRIFYGDGTGFDLRFATRASSTTTDRFTFSDTGKLTISGTDASTSTSSGALVVGNGTSGGLGVGGNIYAGGSLSASGTTTADGLATSGFFGGSKRVVVGYNTSSDYGFIASVDTGIGWKELHLNPVGGVVKVPNTAASTGTSSGALVVSGGVGVAGAIYAGGGLAVTGGSAAAGSIFKTSTLGLVMSGATGSSYDLFLTNPAGNYIMQVPTGTRNVEFAATLTTIGNITSGAAIATSAPAGGSGSWELGVYSTTAPAATGYVTIEIGGTAYKLLASNV